MKTDDRVWQTEQVAQRYLEGVRGAIPLAEEQIQIMLRLVQSARPGVATFLDLGCGDGVLGRAILAQYPKARGVFLDFSEPMLASAKGKMNSASNAGAFILQDYGKKSWLDSLTEHKPFDVVVSGFSIHHQPNRRKKEIYREIFHLLKPGGIFLNLEHVASHSKWSASNFDEYFVDALFAFHSRHSGNESREQLARDYCHRADRLANILASVEDQCRWLREIGYVRVDCFFKVFELALFGGTKPGQGR